MAPVMSLPRQEVVWLQPQAHFICRPERRQPGTPGSSNPRILGTFRLVPSHTRAIIGATQPTWLIVATRAAMTSTAPAAMAILCRVARATILMEKSMVMTIVDNSLPKRRKLACQKKKPSKLKKHKVAASEDEGPEDTFLANHDPLDNNSE